jgi:hypothetical protein
MKNGRPEAHPSLSHSGLYFCGKNDVLCYFIERQVMTFFFTIKSSTEAVSTFVEKCMSYVTFLNDNINFYGAKLIICNHF